MTQSIEEICQLVGTHEGQRWNADDNKWEEAKRILGNERVTLGPVASHSWLHQPEHIAFQLARYRAAAALIGNAESVIEIGCGEGIGAGILARGRDNYHGVDSDREAVALAAAHHDSRHMRFRCQDILEYVQRSQHSWDAVVALDVLEHIPAEHEDTLLHNAAVLLTRSGVLVIGTPSQYAEHLASPQSKAGHCNVYTPERLRDLMARHFRVVQMLYMQDTSIHLGHPGMAHYILAVGIGPKVGA